MRLMKNMKIMKVMKIIQPQLRLSSFRSYEIGHLSFKKLVLGFKCGSPGQISLLSVYYFYLGVNIGLLSLLSDAGVSLQADLFPLSINKTMPCLATTACFPITWHRCQTCRRFEPLQSKVKPPSGRSAPDGVWIIGGNALSGASILTGVVGGNSYRKLKA
jgi:hypothetical protein